MQDIQFTINMIILQLIVHSLNYFQWIFYLNSHADLQLTRSMPLEVWQTQYYNRACRLPQMVQIKNSLTSHSTERGCKHIQCCPQPEQCLQTGLPQVTLQRWCPVQIHSHLADIQENKLQDQILKAWAKQSRSAIQLSSNSGVNFRGSYSSAFEVLLILWAPKDPLLPTGLGSTFIKPSQV